MLASKLDARVQHRNANIEAAKVKIHTPVCLLAAARGEVKALQMQRAEIKQAAAVQTATAAATLEAFQARLLDSAQRLTQRNAEFSANVAYGQELAFLLCLAKPELATPPVQIVQLKNELSEATRP
jgi:hypothetical protein